MPSKNDCFVSSESTSAQVEEPYSTVDDVEPTQNMNSEHQTLQIDSTREVASEKSLNLTKSESTTETYCSFDVNSIHDFQRTHAGST